MTQKTRNRFDRIKHTHLSVFCLTRFSFDYFYKVSIIKNKTTMENKAEIDQILSKIKTHIISKNDMHLLNNLRAIAMQAVYKENFEIKAVAEDQQLRADSTCYIKTPIDQRVVTEGRMYVLVAFKDNECVLHEERARWAQKHNLLESSELDIYALHRDYPLVCRNLFEEHPHGEMMSNLSISSTKNVNDLVCILNLGNPTAEFSLTHMKINEKELEEIDFNGPGEYYLYIHYTKN